MSFRIPRRSVRVRLATLIATLMVIPLAACSASDDDGRPTVVASFYPLQYVVDQIAGDRVRVVNLTAPGVEPHDLDPSTKQISEISGADLVVYSDGLAPAVDKAVEQNAGKDALDVSKVVDLTDDNPHFWLDPLRLEKAAEAVEARLAEAVPDHADEFATNLAALKTTLEGLDAAYTAGLKDCARNLVVTSHDAFGYQKRYGLEFAPIAGLSPDAEPSPARIAELHDLIKSDGITTVFSETIASPKMAETLADELGLRAAVLDPLEGIAKGSSEDYASIMKSNLVSLQEANGCRVQS
ncbi:zinc ABC transporter substrate-binding protein [Nocardioides marmoriginsengisoli]|uniref:Zinc ABC transporter substrate-binding protein n=1 Tax=Nocardioides marmoriginsengisoli TaxID=661483 RepID=A0A3N0CNG0_9ACTN|nr:metal ABC transporter substrate-binding protein [Nocardioides marmoriginsengisoli]RNL64965.1 zinc ABC transporter substrate-binding protein [Nocardioides marmoriginsengisoli]